MLGVVLQLIPKMASTMRTIFCRPGIARLLRNRSISISAGLGETFDVKDEADFKKRVLEATKPVVVDFHAGWCEPCARLGPVLTRVVDGRGGKVDLAKVDVDVNQELALRYGVQSIPTVLLMENGEQKNSFCGLAAENEVEEFVPKD